MGTWLPSPTHQLRDTLIWRWNLRALGLALGVLLVLVARALVLVSIRAGRNAFALLAADSAVLQAPVFHSCFRAPSRALGVAEALRKRKRKNTHITTKSAHYSIRKFSESKDGKTTKNKIEETVIKCCVYLNQPLRSERRRSKGQGRRGGKLPRGASSFSPAPENVCIWVEESSTQK